MSTRWRKNLHGLRCAIIVVLLVWLPMTSASADVAMQAQLRAYTEAQQQRPIPPAFARADFIAQPVITQVMLALDGRQIAWLRQEGERRELWAMGVSGGQPRRLLLETDADTLRWSGDARQILLQSSRALQAVPADGRSGGGLISALGGRERRTLLAVERGPDGGVLLVEQVGPLRRRQWQLVLVDMQARRTLLASGSQKITGALRDARGRLAWLQRIENGQRVILRSRDGQLQPVLRCTHLQRCMLLSLAPRDGAWLRSDLGGSIAGLQRLDAEGRLHRVHEDPQHVADVDELALDPLDGQPRLLAYQSTAQAWYALAAADVRHLDTIRAALPGHALSIQPGPAGAPTWLVQATMVGSPQRRWFLYAPGNGRLRQVLEEVPATRRTARAVQALFVPALAAPLAVHWRASDGMRIHGLLWLPPGRDPGRAPLVVNVHGGPWNLFRPDYRAVTQLLANRGYAVFEPNFRGSSGFGRDYLLAARGDFGNGRVQRDIVEGTRWLLGSGIGDRARVAITGASFGGYAALLGVSFQPDLFQTAVAIVPPPDFGWSLRWILRNPEALALDNGMPMLQWLREVGLDVTDGKQMADLHAQSPLANVQRLQRPVLLLAGGNDQRVGRAGVIEYAARLRHAGKQVSLLLDPDAGHSNQDAVAQEATLLLLEAMLHVHLQGPAPVPPDAAVRGWTERNLRLPQAGGCVAWMASAILCRRPHRVETNGRRADHQTRLTDVAGG